MRIATIDLDGTPSAALVEDDAVRPLPGVGMLDALSGRLAEAGEPIALADVRLLSPIEPASVRDFSVFEQHGEGAAMYFAGPDANVRTPGTSARRSTSPTRTPRRARAT